MCLFQRSSAHVSTHVPRLQGFERLGHSQRRSASPSQHRADHLRVTTGVNKPADVSRTRRTCNEIASFCASIFIQPIQPIYHPSRAQTTCPTTGILPYKPLHPIINWYKAASYCFQLHIHTGSAGYGHCHAYDIHIITQTHQSTHKTNTNTKALQPALCR